MELSELLRKLDHEIAWRLDRAQTAASAEGAMYWSTVAMGMESARRLLTEWSAIHGEAV